MKRKTKWIAGGAVALAVIGGGASVGLAATSGDQDTPLAGSTLDKAVAAALQETGGGTVTETEIGDGGAAYSVEIRLQDGSQVEVSLDESYAIIGQEVDDDGPNDQDGPNDS